MKIDKIPGIKKLVVKLDREPALLFFMMTFVLGIGTLAVASTPLLKVLGYSYMVLNILIIFMLGKEE